MADGGRVNPIGPEPSGGPPGRTFLDTRVTRSVMREEG